jgi:multicomponent Na+:H+ antiporter subunit D
MAGLWGKWYLSVGALDAGYGVLVGVLMLSTLLNIAYLLPIPIRAFFARGTGQAEQWREAPLPCLVAIGFTTVACVVLFFFPEPVYQLASMLVR